MDYRSAQGRPKERRLPRRSRASGLLLAIALAVPLAGGCKSASECIGKIPEELRADVVRMALDKRFVPAGKMPRADLMLAHRHGTPPPQLDPERAKLVKRYVLAYQTCILDRVR